MRILVVLITCLVSCAQVVAAFEDRQVFAGENARQTLRVLSNTDTDVFAPVAEGFLKGNPDVTLDYAVTGSADIVTQIEACADCFDVVISSAMDLQLKFANDGLALPLPAINQAPWAQWRHSLFGFTREPATMVINRAAFRDRPIPRTRRDLIEVLRAEPEYFRGKLGTYDVRLAGLGYLFATQDARTSETYWRLMEIFGSLEAKLYCCSRGMIDDLAKGELFVAYNVLGSYADTRPDVRDAIEVVTPDDFATTMMRTAFVMANSPVPDVATRFVDYLASGAWAEQGSPLTPLKTDRQGPQSVIALEPGLLVHLDQMKKRLFVKEWTSALRR